MKIFLSALEQASISKYRGENGKALSLAHYFTEQGIKFKWNLMSFFYIKKNISLAEYIRDKSEEILIDSGAHSFQKGIKVDWESYTDLYCDFIKKFDRPNVLGYFEMDVDNIIGYDRVKALRKRLESVSNKIIPVWHKERGIDEFKSMCREYSGKIIAITGFRNEDIKDHQYMLFLKYAKKHNCKVHCLGMTRKNILDTTPFDFVDSSSWKQSALFGRVDRKGKVTRDFSKEKREVVFKENYLAGMKMQNFYYNKWRHIK